MKITQEEYERITTHNNIIPHIVLAVYICHKYNLEVYQEEYINNSKTKINAPWIMEELNLRRSEVNEASDVLIELELI